MKSLSDSLLIECKARLLNARMEILNRLRFSRSEFAEMDKVGGDEADQTMQILAEHEFLSRQERLVKQLMEIDLALARIESGSYGVCEETEEIIETERLRAIPWTTLSIEGAEIRENLRRKYR